MISLLRYLNILWYFSYYKKIKFIERVEILQLYFYKKFRS